MQLRNKQHGAGQWFYQCNVCNNLIMSKSNSYNVYPVIVDKNPWICPLTGIKHWTPQKENTMPILKGFPPSNTIGLGKLSNPKPYYDKEKPTAEQRQAYLDWYCSAFPYAKVKWREIVPESDR